MKKPIGYHGYAWDKFCKGYTKKYCKSKKGKKAAKKYYKRMKKYQKFYKKNGFDPTETWNLDYTIIMFILPRLKYFKDNLNGHPHDITFEEWEDILDKVIKSFEYIADIENDINFSKKRYKEFQEGMQLFAKYILNLWD